MPPPPGTSGAPGAAVGTVQRNRVASAAAGAWTQLQALRADAVPSMPTRCRPRRSPKLQNLPRSRSGSKSSTAAWLGIGKSSSSTSRPKVPSSIPLRAAPPGCLRREGRESPMSAQPRSLPCAIARGRSRPRQPPASTHNPRVGPLKHERLAGERGRLLSRRRSSTVSAHLRLRRRGGVKELWRLAWHRCRFAR